MGLEIRNPQEDGYRSPLFLMVTDLYSLERATALFHTPRPPHCPEDF